MQQTTIINKAVTVKNAKFIEDEQFYYVVHYDHMVLKVDKKTKEILICFPVSPSSQRAVEQGLDYITGKYPYSSELDDVTLKLTGLTRNELQKMWKPKRNYSMSNNERINFKNIDIEEYEQRTLLELA